MPGTSQPGTSNESKIYRKEEKVKSSEAKGKRETGEFNLKELAGKEPKLGLSIQN